MGIERINAEEARSDIGWSIKSLDRIEIPSLTAAVICVWFSFTCGEIGQA